MKKSAILYAAALTSVNGAIVNGVDNCTAGMEDDTAKPERIQNCSTLKKCYNTELATSENSACILEESCGSWKAGGRGSRNGCILSKYCDATGTYAEVDQALLSDILFNCPVGKKPTVEVQNWMNTLTEADYKSLYAQSKVVEATDKPKFPITEADYMQTEIGKLDAAGNEVVQQITREIDINNDEVDPKADAALQTFQQKKSEKDTKKVWLNPTDAAAKPDQGAVKIDLHSDDKLYVKTLKDNAAEITFEGTDGAKLEVTSTADDKLTIKYTNNKSQLFDYKSDGGAFTIPWLSADPKELNKLVASGTSGARDFATYTKVEGQSSSSLIIPELRLRLNLKKFEGAEITHTEEVPETRLVMHGGSCPVLGAGAKKARAEWDYKQVGADWPAKYPDCALPQQSPINLLTPRTKYGRAYDIYDYAEDAHVPSYGDLAAAVVGFHPIRYTVQVPIKTEGYSGFTSMVGKDILGGPEQWEAAEFVLKTGSEHTIDGKRFDLELQVFHNADAPRDEHESSNTEEKPAEEAAEGGHRRLAGEEDPAKKSEQKDARDLEVGGFKYGAVALLFTIDDAATGPEAELFDKLFDSLRLEEADPHVPRISFAEAMGLVDWSRRWAYKGSRTAPPCGQFVYWNIIQKVYPIKRKYVEAFKAKLAPLGLNVDGQNGNWREVQKGFNRDVVFIGSEALRLAAEIASMITVFSYVFN